MNLLEKIDKELSILNESIDPVKEKQIMEIAKSIDSNIASNAQTLKNIWGPKDAKWNKLIEPVISNDIETYVVQLVEGYYIDSKNALSSEFMYLKWDGDLATGNTLTVKLTNLEDATRVAKPLNSEELKKLKINLQEDPNSKAIKYKDLKCIPYSGSNNPLKVYDIVSYYYELFVNASFSDLSEYWQRAAQVSVGSTKNIISNDILQFLIKAHGDATLSTCLRNDQIASETIYALLDDNSSKYSMTVDQILNYKRYFLLALLVYGCYDKSGFNSVSDVIQSFAIFDKVRNDFEYGQLKLKNNLEQILQGDSSKEKALTLAQNLLTYSKSIENNALLVALPNVSEYIEEQTFITPINIEGGAESLSNLRVCNVAEVKSILDDIVDELNTERNKYFLVVGDNKYQLLEDNNTHILYPKNNKVIFTNNKTVVVAFGLSSSIDDKDNQFTDLTDLNSSVIFNFAGKDENTNYVVSNYFEIVDGLLVTRDDFVLENKGRGGASLFSIDINQRKLEVKTPPRVATEQDIEQEKEKQKQEKSNKEKKLDEETKEKLKQAVIDYLKVHKTKLLSNDNQIEKFIKTPQSQNYEKLKELILEQLFEKPEIYYYDNETNEIKNVENTYMSILVSILNNNVEEAKNKLYSITSHNISPYIDVQYRKLPAPKQTAQEIAQKLDNLSNILKQDVSSATDKIDSKVKKELSKPERKDELAQLIAWFNSRLAKKNSATIKSNDANNSNPENNNE